MQTARARRLRLLHDAHDDVSVGAAVDGSGGITPAGDRHRVERHGHRRPRALPSRSGAARPEEHGPVRRLSGRRHARTVAGRRREDSQDHGRDRSRSRRAIEHIDSMSAHADAGEIMRWLSGSPPPPTMTYLVHGEPVALEALRGRMARKNNGRSTWRDIRRRVEIWTT